MKPPLTKDRQDARATRRRSVGIKTFSSLKHRDLRFLLGGTFFMSAGNLIQQVTLGGIIGASFSSLRMAR